MKGLARRSSPLLCAFFCRSWKIYCCFSVFSSCVMHAYCIATLFIRWLLILMFRCIDLPACMQIPILVRSSHVITFPLFILTVYFNVEFCTSHSPIRRRWRGWGLRKTFSLARFISVAFKTDFLRFHWILQSSLVFLALIPYSRLFAQSWLCTMWSGCKETQKKLQKRFPNAHQARSMWRIHKSSFAFLPAFFLLFIFSRKLLRLIVFIRPRWHWLNALLASSRFVSAMLYVYALISEQIEFNLLFRIRKSPPWQHFEIVF